MHCVAASNSEYLPGKQLLHIFAPLTSAYVPDLHVGQSFSWYPGTLIALPALHNLHFNIPLLFVYCPGLHNLHPSVDKPMMLLEVPLWHLWHVLEAERCWYFPASHTWHKFAPQWLVYLPFSHAYSLPLVAKWPGRATEQFTECRWGEYVPSGHCLQKRSTKFVIVCGGWAWSSSTIYRIVTRCCIYTCGCLCEH